MRRTSIQRWLMVLFSFYLLMLTWIILFKMACTPADLPHLRSVNLIPLGGPLRVNGQADYGEVVQNLLAFVPFGVYLGLLLPEKPFVLRLFPAFVVSLVYECLQFIFALGATDVTDLLSNTLGALIGLAVYALFRLLCRDKTEIVLSMLAAIASVLMGGLVFMLIVLN